MTSEGKNKVSTENQIPIDKDKLKDEQKAQLNTATDAYEQRCLLSFSTNRSGDVIKKYDFPTLPPYDESQKEDRMVHMMNQAIGQALMCHAPIMANYVHNAVLKTLQVGMKTVGNGRENHSTVPATVFFGRERKRKRKNRTRKRNRYYGISGTESIGWEHADYDRESITQNEKIHTTTSNI